MKPFGKILVPIGLDLGPGPILDLVATVAGAFGAQVTLLHVFETPGYRGPQVLDPAQAGTPELQNALKHWRTAKAMMDLVQGLGSRGIPAVGRMAFGTIEETVASLAGKEGFDLVIIGSQERTSLERFLTPSVAAALIRTSPCPVLVLPRVLDVI
ncbi:MAG: universal stress protein [Holophaga sp.]|jgi:nucleotide-binding universal stress UspA family protein